MLEQGTLCNSVSFKQQIMPESTDCTPATWLPQARKKRSFQTFKKEYSEKWPFKFLSSLLKKLKDMTMKFARYCDFLWPKQCHEWWGYISFCVPEENHAKLQILMIFVPENIILGKACMSLSR